MPFLLTRWDKSNDISDISGKTDFTSDSQLKNDPYPKIAKMKIFFKNRQKVSDSNENLLKLLKKIFYFANFQGRLSRKLFSRFLRTWSDATQLVELTKKTYCITYKKNISYRSKHRFWPLPLLAKNSFTEFLPGTSIRFLSKNWTRKTTFLHWEKIFCCSPPCDFGGSPKIAKIKTFFKIGKKCQKAMKTCSNCSKKLSRELLVRFSPA